MRAELSPIELNALVTTLRQVGIPLSIESARIPALRSFSRREAADLLGVSVSWIRAHETEFPGRWRAGEDIRIPLADLEDLVRRNRVAPALPTPAP